jgi:hypothetical protein
MLHGPQYWLVRSQFHEASFKFGCYLNLDIEHADRGREHGMAWDLEFMGGSIVICL